MKPEPIHHLSKLSSQYDAFIFAIFGVLHDGEQVIDTTLATINEIVASGKFVFLLTNSPNRSHVVIEQLNRLGIDERLYHGILTAGDQIHHVFHSTASASFCARLGKTCYFIGSKSMKDILPTSEYALTRDINSADFILAAGPDNSQSAIEQYEDVLTKGAKQSLPLVCSNPDVHVFHNDKPEIRAGRLAAFYETLGGKVYFYGKPHAFAYEMTCGRLSHIRKERMLMIGDSIYTDIIGANGATIDSLLTISKTTLFELNCTLDAADFVSIDQILRRFDNPEFMPTYISFPLRW